MKRRLAWYDVLWVAGLAMGCGRVSLRDPGADAGPVVPDVDARPIEPVIDAAPPPSDAAPEPLDPSLIAWYPLDDAGDGFTVDATGNGHDAQCVPDPASCPFLIDGVQGGAMQFNGFDHLRVSGGDGFFDSYDGFTVAAWVRLEAPFVSAPLSKMLGNETGNSWQFEFIDDLRPAFTTANFNSRHVDAVNTPVEPETWVHLAGSWDGFSKRFYVNGSLEYVIDEHFVDFDDSDFLIGADENNGELALPFSGRVDDVRIYDRALEDDEVAALAAP
jgi:hypothetical protein